MGNKWLDDFKLKVVEIGRKTGKNVSHVVSVKKIEVEIMKVTHEINKLYRIIGELVYTAKENNEKANVDTLCKQISVKNKYIKELKNRIKYINEKKKIDESDRLYEDIPDFVTTEDGQDEIAVLKFCPKCNTGNELENDVCKKCGSKLKDKIKK